MVRACLLLLVGGFAAQHSRLYLDSDYWIAALVALLLLRSRRRRDLLLLLLGAGLFAVAAGDVVDDRLNPTFAGDSMLATVRIVGIPKVEGMTTVLHIAPVDDHRLPPLSRVTWFEPDETLSRGEIWQLELRLRRPRGVSNPDGFDREAWFLRERVHASGYVVAGKRNVRIGATPPSLVDAFRDNAIRRATRTSSDSRSAAVLAAISVGARHGIGREQWDTFAITGSSHLMAISGLHVGLAAGAAFVLLAVIGGVFRVPGCLINQAIVGGFLCALMYAVVSGFGIPARRAIVMLLIAAVASLARRQGTGLHMLGIAAAAVFVSDPLSIMAPGFLLSFLAVGVLLWQTKFCRPGIFAKIRAVFALQSALFFGLLPAVVGYFGRVSLLAPFVNFVVVPIFSLAIVPLALSAMLFDSDLFAVTASAAIAVSNRIIDAFATIPGADVATAAVDGTLFLSLTLVTVWVVLPRGWPGRWLAVIAVAAVIAYRPVAPRHGCINGHVLDVGQGLAVVVRTRHHVMLFDTGPSYRGTGSAAEYVLLPFLRRMGINRVDTLVVSHGDDDHAGGVGAVLEAIAVDRILQGEPLEAELNYRCERGQMWSIDDVRFEVLHPLADSRREGNDASCVIVISTGEHRLILTGDIEAAAEQQLVQLGLPASDLVVVPHHGSSTSSTRSFIDALNADIAIVSAAHANRWGFPKEAVARRWRDADVDLVETATSGAVSFKLCRDEGLTELRENRIDRRRFWRDP